jgi:hypothetical protein
MKSEFITGKTFAQHGLEEVFTDHSSHQQVRVEHAEHLLNTDLAQHGLAKSVLSISSQNKLSVEQKPRCKRGVIAMARGS